MALLLPLFNFFSLPHHKFSSFTPHCLTLHPPHKRFAISASSIKKPRARKKAKSNADLCNDLLEFVVVVGLPEGHVPSMKDLLQHGRKDLANVVRRRGYKLMTELLANPKLADVDRPSKDQSLTEIQDAASYSQGQDQEVNDLIEDVSSSSENSTKGRHTISANTDLDLSHQDRIALKSSMNLSLQEKVANFIRNGNLDLIEDDGYNNLNESDTEDTKDFIASENVLEIESSNVDDHLSETVLGGRSVATVLNGSARHDHLSGDIDLSNEGLNGANVDKELDVKTSKRENQVEINHLKFMLHQKELELSQLKEQIEKEKLALSILQTKAETEISKARERVSETDAELHGAEESLLGLEEVEIQYLGDGEIVEVTGSFNGWHHRIEMDPLPSSSIIDFVESRKPKLWTTLLWLYPGIYEIKFIVDGHWRIDPQRESVTSGNIQNNILRVEK